MLLGELRRWGLAPEVVDRLLPHADRALEWITDLRRPGRRRLRRVPAQHRPGRAPPDVEGLHRPHPIPGRAAGPRAVGARRGPGLRVRRLPGAVPLRRRGRRRPPPPPVGGPWPRSCKGGSTATSGSTTRAGWRWRWTATSARSDRWPRTSGTACGPASSTRTRPPSWPSSWCPTTCSPGGACGPWRRRWAATTRSARTPARCGRTTMPPAWPAWCATASSTRRTGC